MAANTTTTVEVADEEIIGALDVIRRHARLKKTVQVFTEAGVTEATGYRRLNDPGDIKLEELAAISRKFGVPLYIIAEGELATARWFKEKPSGPGPLGGLEISRRGCNVVTLEARRTGHFARSA
jgi:DNA-binding phage protein